MIHKILKKLTLIHCFLLRAFWWLIRWIIKLVLNTTVAWIMNYLIIYYSTYILSIFEICHIVFSSLHLEPLRLVNNQGVGTDYIADDGLVAWEWPRSLRRTSSVLWFIIFVTCRCLTLFRLRITAMQIIASSKVCRQKYVRKLRWT